MNYKYLFYFTVSVILPAASVLFYMIGTRRGKKRWITYGASMAAQGIISKLSKNMEQRVKHVLPRIMEV